MKIALYVPSWPPGRVSNGIVTYASHLVPALRQLGHEVFVLTYASGEVSPYTIDLKRFAPAPSFFDRAKFRLTPATAVFHMMSFAIAAAIRDLVAKHQIDVFEVEESFGWSLAASRLNLIPVVVRLHGPWFLTGKFDGQNNKINSRKARMEGQGIQHAHYVTANCRETLDSVRDHYGLTLTNSRIVPTPIEPVSDRETWNVDACKQESIIFVGRFDKLKGGDLVVRAFAQLAESYPRLTLTFIGPDRGIKAIDGKIWSFDQFVREFIPEAIRSRIDFRGHVNHAEVMALRAQHFITIAAAQYDTMGYLILEAMALGCPLVATAVGGIPEFIKDQRNGLLVPSQDPDAMAAACKSLLDNNSLAARIGRRAWLDCRESYSSDSVAKQMVAAYREAIDLANLPSPEDHSHSGTTLTQIETWPAPGRSLW